MSRRRRPGLVIDSLVIDMAQQIAIDAPSGPSFSRLMRQSFRALVRDLFNPYRPEQHYMRGPGPKWHAKHGASRSL